MFDGLLSPEAAATYVSLLRSGPADVASVDAGLRNELLSRGFVSVNSNVGFVAALHPVVVHLHLQAALGREFAEKQARLVTTYASLDSLSAQFANVQFLDQRYTSCYVLTEPKAAAAVHEAFYQAVRFAVRDWETGPYRSVHERGESLVGNPLLPRRDAVQRGVEYRTVYDCQYLALPGARATIEMSIEAGEIARLIDRLPMKLAILDERAALVPVDPYGRSAVLIRDRALVGLFIAFFDLVWSNARPYRSPDTEGPSSKHAHGPLVALMAAGLKDEAIARQLGVSVRTVRRQIADLCKQLEMSNRFAAGVAAWKAGLIRSDS